MSTAIIIDYNIIITIFDYSHDTRHVCFSPVSVDC